MTGAEKAVESAEYWMQEATEGRAACTGSDKFLELEAYKAAILALQRQHDEDVARMEEFGEMLDNELALWTPDKAMPLDYELSRPDISRSRYELAIRRDQVQRIILGWHRTARAQADAHEGGS